MFTRSHLQEMKRRYASMYAPLIEEKFEEHCGVCGEQGIEEVEIDESLALQLKMAFDDAKIKMKSKKGKIVIAKKDKKKATDVLTKTLPSKLKKYVDKAIGNFLVFEEIEIDEGLKDGQMVTLAQDPTVTGEYLMIPPAKAFPKTASDSIVGFKDKSLKKGKKVRVKIHNRKTYIELPKKVSVFVQVKDWEKNFQEEVEIKEEVELDEKETAYPPTIKNLGMIVKDKQHQKFMFKSGQAIVDLFSASAIIAVYDGMKKPELKKKLEDMIKTKEGFLKTQAFAMKMVK